MINRDRDEDINATNNTTPTATMLLNSLVIPPCILSNAKQRKCQPQGGMVRLNNVELTADKGPKDKIGPKPNRLNVFAVVQKHNQSPTFSIPLV